MIHIAKSLVLKSLLLILVLSAILIGSMRLLVPVVSHFQSDVEQWVSQQLERPVRIGSLAARWHGLGPELVLNSLEIYSPDDSGSALKLAELRISFAILDSLRNLEIKTRQITFSGVKLLVTRHRDGAITVGGLDRLSKGGAGGDSSSLFAVPSRIRLEKSEIAFDNQLVDGTAGPLRFEQVDALLLNHGQRHQLTAELPFPGGGQLELKADIQGEVGLSDSWQADLYFKGKNIALANALRARLSDDWAIDSGNLNLELWGRWEEGRFKSTQGSSDIVQLSLRRHSTELTSDVVLDIERLGGNFQWHVQPDGWQLDLRNFEYQGNTTRWPELALSMAARRDDEGRVRLLVGANYARAADLSNIAQLFLVQQPVVIDGLQKTDIHGDIYDLRFEMEEGREALRWSLQGRFESLISQPWKSVPGVQNLDAEFWLSDAGGSLQVDGASTVLDFSGLFRDPLELKTLQGQISWMPMEEGGWRLEAPSLVAVSRDIQTRTRLLLDIPADDGSLFMDLQTDFVDGRAINAHRYYPVGIMPPAVVAWLDRGIVDGKVTSGSALVRGPLRDFPFHQSRNGVFEVFFHTENMTIDYAPGWPRLTDVAAEVRFLQNGFDVQLERGRILDSQLFATQGGISDFGSAPFKMQGSVRGALQDNLRLLRESPLAEDFAVFTEQVTAAGESVTSIDLSIPIHDDQQLALSGKLDLAGNSLNLQDWRLRLTEIQGELNFTHEKIEARKLRAKTLGSNVTVDIKTLSRPRDLTQITADMQISSQQLAQQFPELDFGLAKGRSAVRMQLDIPHHSVGEGDAYSLRFSSNLKGVDIDLPPPFGKRSEQTRNLSIAIDFLESGNLLTAEYGGRTHLILKAQAAADGSQKFTRGALQFGEGPASLPTVEGLEITGRLESLDLKAWSSALPAGDAGGIALNSIDLAVKKVSVGEFELDDLHLVLRRDQERLKADISSLQTEGQVEIPLDPFLRPVLVRLKRFSFSYDPSQKEEPSIQETGTADPRKLPAIDLEVEKTEINGKDYGKLQLSSQRVADGLNLQSLSINGGYMKLSVSGEWKSYDNGRQRSLLQLSLTTSSLGDLLKDLGYPRYIDRAPGDIDMALNWPHSLLDFRPGILNGQITLKLGKGQFMNVDPGIGRVFGLLNITALQRRLSLDFSDLLNKGLAFDSVSGSFDLDNGDAYTNDFQISGPSATIDITGRTGLETEDFDQLVTVTPHLSAALPVAGLIAGGPVGGAAMLLAQGLIGKEFDKASKLQYEVKGPWENPQMVPLGSETPAMQAAAADNSGEQQKGMETAAADNSGEQEESVEVPKPTEEDAFPGLFDLLKKQLTPTTPKFPERRDGAPANNY